MIKEKKEEVTGLNLLGFTRDWHKRYVFIGVLAVSITGNIYQFKKYAETTDATQKVFHEMIEKSLETKQRVDSLKIHIE